MYWMELRSGIRPEKKASITNLEESFLYGELGFVPVVVLTKKVYPKSQYPMELGPSWMKKFSIADRKWCRG